MDAMEFKRTAARFRVHAVKLRREACETHDEYLADDAIDGRELERADAKILAADAWIKRAENAEWLANLAEA